MVRKKKDTGWVSQQINSWTPVRGLDENSGLRTTTKVLAQALKRGKEKWTNGPSATWFANLGKEKTGNDVSAKTLNYRVSKGKEDKTPTRLQEGKRKKSDMAEQNSRDLNDFMSSPVAKDLNDFMSSPVAKKAAIKKTPTHPQHLVGALGDEDEDGPPNLCQETEDSSPAKALPEINIGEATPPTSPIKRFFHSLSAIKVTSPKFLSLGAKEADTSLEYSTVKQIHRVNLFDDRFDDSEESECQGTISRPSDDPSMNNFIACYLRSAVSSFEVFSEGDAKQSFDCTFELGVGTILHRTPNEENVRICVEKDMLVLRSQRCTFQSRRSASNNKSTKCDACHKIRNTVSPLLHRSRPREAPIIVDPKTSIHNLVRHPELAAIAIRDARQKARQLKAENRRLRLGKRLKTQGVVVHDPIRAQKVDQIMRHAYNKVGSEEAGFDKEQDEDTRDLFSVYFEHVHKNQDYFRTGKKTSGLRFDPLLFNFALLILARTSQSTYSEIGKVMLLPSLSMVSP
jgi:hypothetical protein